MGFSKVDVCSGLLRVALTVIMFGKTVCFTMTYNSSSASSNIFGPSSTTWIASNTVINSTSAISIPIFGITPSSSFIQPIVVANETMSSSSSSVILIPMTSFTSQRTSVVLRQTLLSTSIISQGTTPTVPSTLGTSIISQGTHTPTVPSTLGTSIIISQGTTPTVPSTLGILFPTSPITPSRTARSVQATSSIILMPPKVKCYENHMQIELDKNTYSNLNSSSFHLRDSTCTGDVIGRTIKLTTPLNKCNTSSMQTEDAITYQNEVRAEETFNKHPNDTVTRHDAMVLPFNCTYSRRRYVGVTSFKPKRRVDAEEGAFGNFTFLMDVYSDQSYSHAYNTSDYPISIGLNQQLYIKYRVLSNKADLYVFAEKCLATTTTSESTTPNYVFIDKGCSRDKTVDYQYKTRNREQTFSIQTFRFIADHPVVYIHCLLLVCHSSYNTSKCAVGCSNSRARRDMSRNDKESNLYHLSSGPITMKKTTKSTPDTNAPSGFVVIALSSTVAVLLIGCCVLMFMLRRKIKRSTKTQGNSEPTQLEVYDNPGVKKEDDPVGMNTSNQQDDVNGEDDVL